MYPMGQTFFKCPLYRVHLRTCTDAEISQLTGCENKEELTSFHEDLIQLIKKHVLKEYLPEKFK
jgi:hypothetical protein